MHRDKLFTAAYLATANATTAMQLVNEVAKKPAPLASLICILEDRLPRATTSFTSWDQVLRCDITTASFDPEPDVRHAYLWELKRQCLASTLQCISVCSRLAFIVVDVLGVSFDDALGAFHLIPVALNSRLQRARAALESYLEPRCGHLDRANPCSCNGRVGIAERKGILSLPIIPVPSRRHDAPVRGLSGLYRELRISCPGGLS